MQACLESVPTNFLVGPRSTRSNLEKCMPVFQPGKYLPKRLRIDDQSEGMFPRCASSLPVRQSPPRRIAAGPFREDYFIEYIDIEIQPARREPECSGLYEAGS